ncbi:MAG: MarR family protein [Candidatus Bathyarchaeota archaeon BA2]|nr:MAG: MarR family protein [Candidatus Bathyarchaeota archaeon BA2]
MYSDLLLMVVATILLITMGASVLYYRRIRRVSEEYEEAKGVVDDIVISFNRQFQKQEDRLSIAIHETEVVSFEGKKIVDKMEKQDRRLADLAGKIEAVSEIKQNLSTQIEKVDKKVNGLIASQERLVQRIVKIEKVGYKAPISEAKIEAAIPIKKEKALAPLTETELAVLEILAKEGGKTAPEIRERIGLTREHTARLMKKLYGDGYLERDTRKMPYTYRLKEEMLKILKKREAKV